MATIGEMIAGLEQDMEAYRAADLRIKIWEQMFKVAPEYEKRKMLVSALKELAGMTDEEINKILVAPKS